MRRSRFSARRSRVPLAAASVATVVAVVVVAVVAVRGNPQRAHDGGGATTTSTSAATSTTSTTSPTTTTVHESTTTTTSPLVTPIGTYGVATTSLTVTVAGLPATDDSLPTTVWYPVAKSAAPARAGSRSDPLLVFSQGFAEPVSSYSTLIADWASAGFVVAGPAYPHTSPSTPTSLDRADLVRHPDDLRAVISALVDAARRPGSALSGRIDASEIGVVGQSDGGDVSLAVADDTCCRDTAVKAAAILSGAEYTDFGGEYFSPAAPPGPPLLAVQGSEDPINPAVCSTQFYDAATPPKYYLDLLDATHLGPYTATTPYEAVVAAVTTEFFDAELAAEPLALTRMAGSGDVAGVAQLTSSPTAPAASGTCPTSV